MNFSKLQPYIFRTVLPVIFSAMTRIIQWFRIELPPTFFSSYLNIKNIKNITIHRRRIHKNIVYLLLLKISVENARWPPIADKASRQQQHNYIQWDQSSPGNSASHYSVQSMIKLDFSAAWVVLNFSKDVPKIFFSSWNLNFVWQKSIKTTVARSLFIGSIRCIK